MPRSFIIGLFVLFIASAPMAAEPVTDPALVQAHYAQVLTATEYQEKPSVDFFSQLNRWFYAFLRSLNESMSEFAYGAQVASLSYFTMCLILLFSFLGIVYWIGKRLLMRTGQDGSRQVRPQGNRYFAPPESFDAEIAQAVAMSDWSTALLWNWRRLLAQLERHELVVADRTQTNWEYLAQLRIRTVPAPATNALSRLARAYDLHIYGRRPLSPSEWHSLSDEFQAAVRHLKLDHPVVRSL